MLDIIKWWGSDLRDDCAHPELNIKAILPSERFHFIKVEEAQERISCYKYICVVRPIRKYSCNKENDSQYREPGSCTFTLFRWWYGDLAAQRRKELAHFINVFLPLSCLNIYGCFLQDFIKCHVQTFALPRWHCCKMQDMLLVCHGIIAGVSGAVKPVKWLSGVLSKFTAINANMKDVSQSAK